MSRAGCDRVRHDWTCMGGAGGWEVWECRRCKRSTIPSSFGFLWPTVLQLFLPRFRCRVATADQADPAAVSNGPDRDSS